jgi:voltage-gated potassium channel
MKLEPPPGLKRILWLVRRPGQFTSLLIAILCFLVIPPFFINYSFTGVLASLFLSILLLSVLYVFPRRREFIFACVLAIPTMGGRWFLTFNESEILLYFEVLCWIGFLGITVVVILRQVLSATRVTNDTISGAICGYLLFGIMFAFLYALIELLFPGSYIIDGKPLHAHLGSFYYQHQISTLIYYSLITLATVGYGDIVPVTLPARVLAALEAIAGQFYIAILIARLVSIRYSKWGDED